MMNLNRLAYFAAVVDAGSFTRAAERLGITKAVVSQQVAQLEAEMGATLLLRSTRRVQPTEAGRLFHERCVVILREAEDAYGELAQSTVEPRGVLRVAAPNDYGAEVATPVAAAFVARYPFCRVEMMLGDRRIDLAAGEADMAIRVGWLEDSSLQARRIGGFRQMLVGGRAMAGRLAAIHEPSDLETLPFIANHALRDPLVWRFSRAGREESRTARMVPALSIDASPAILRAVREGAGLSVLPDFLAADHIESGALIHVLPEWELPSGGIHTVYPAARFRPAKVAAFVAMLAEAERARAG